MARNLSGPSASDQRKWETQDALNTIQRAQEHMQNSPLMRRVQALAGQRAQMMSDIAGKPARKRKK